MELPPCQIDLVTPARQFPSHTHTYTRVTCSIHSHFPVPATRRSPLRSVRPRFILVSISFTFLACPILSIYRDTHTHTHTRAFVLSLSLLNSTGSALSPVVSLSSVHFPPSRVCLAGITTDTDNLVTGKYLGDKRPRRGGTASCPGPIKFNLNFYAVPVVFRRVHEKGGRIVLGLKINLHLLAVGIFATILQSGVNYKMVVKNLLIYDSCYAKYLFVIRVVNRWNSLVSFNHFSYHISYMNSIPILNFKKTFSFFLCIVFY